MIFPDDSVFYLDICSQNQQKQSAANLFQNRSICIHFLKPVPVLLLLPFLLLHLQQL